MYSNKSLDSIQFIFSGQSAFNKYAIFWVEKLKDCSVRFIQCLPTIPINTQTTPITQYVNYDSEATEDSIEITGREWGTHTKKKTHTQSCTHHLIVWSARFICLRRTHEYNMVIDQPLCIKVMILNLAHSWIIRRAVHGAREFCRLHYGLMYCISTPLNP